MRILQIYDGDGTVGPQGSVSSVVFYLAKHLAVLGHRVTVLERGTGTNPHLEEIGVSCRRVNVPRRAGLPYQEVARFPLGPLRLAVDRFLLALAFHQETRKPFDVIHVHFPFAACVLVHLARRLRSKMVYTAHVGEEALRLSAAKTGVPLALRIFKPDLHLLGRIRAGVVLNDRLRVSLVVRGFKNVTTIPNGVEVEEFNVSPGSVAELRRQLGLSGRTVLFAGTITPRKGVEVLLRAAALIRDADFLLAGSTAVDADFTARMRRLAAESGLETRVRFLDFVPAERLKVLYAACDVFVLPSFEEGDPVALKEALATGRPLVGTAVGGIPAQIRDGWNGFLVVPGDHRQLAARIARLLERPRERDRMGDNSRRLAEREFHWSRVAGLYENIYRGIA